MKKQVKISIVIPVYNEQECIRRCFDEVSAECQRIGKTYEIIFVNDGSKDKSLDILCDIASKNKQVKVINFSRNFGQRPALMAGFKSASGEAVINIDCDLQDPVRLIGDFVKKWEEGYDVVLGKRKTRKGESFLKKFTAKIYYKLFSWLSKTNTPKDCGIARLLSRRVVDDITSLKEHNIYLAGMTEYVGYKQAIVEYDREARVEGKTKYSIKKLVRLAINNILPYSSMPLDMVFAGGVTMSVGGVIMLVTLLILTLCCIAFSQVLWIIGTMVLCTGILLASLGVVGAYVFLGYMESLDRPRYIIERMINFDENKE